MTTNEMNVLDIGCGRGKFLNMIDTTKIGLDISMRNLKIIKTMQASSNIHLILADAENLPLKTISFDLIHLSSTLHHLPNYLNVLKAAIHLLKNHGLLYLSEPNRNGIPLIWAIEKLAQIRGHFYEFHSGIDIINVLSLLKREGLYPFGGIESPIRFEGRFFIRWYFDLFISTFKVRITRILGKLRLRMPNPKRIFTSLDSIISKILPLTFKTWTQCLFIKKTSYPMK